MKQFKLILLCFIVTLVMAISWAIGAMIGNAITASTPPPPPDASHAGEIFLAVCAFNSVLIVTLLTMTKAYSGAGKRIALVSYVFVVQFLLTQIETFFFAEGIGIGHDQTVAIVMAGAISSAITMIVAMIVYDKFIGKSSIDNPLGITFTYNRSTLLLLAFLILIGYPFLYLTFGYYVAWQSENLRIFYTSSSDIDPFLPQTAKAFFNGIYLLQIVRGLIWILVTVPMVAMLQGNPIRQFLIVAVLSALLPTSLLFIPNPYMPRDISMTHFIETSTSNFLWGLLMVWGIRKGLTL
ncbi:MAG: hypothetical protein ABJA70_16650 [Chryseolinea sp.]